MQTPVLSERTVLRERMVLRVGGGMRRSGMTALVPAFPMCGTELSYGPARLLCDVRLYCYAMSGTDLAYGPTRLLCDDQY
eukprot:1243111-Rhodomonas_salina.4